MRPRLSILAILPIAAPCFGQIRVVNYNTLDGPTPGVHDNAANMQAIFTAMAAQSVNGIARRPDLLILQEQTATSAGNLASLLNGLFAGANYLAVTPSGQPNDDRQAFVYDATALSLIGSGTSIATGEVRPVIRAQFRPVGYTTSAASFYAYGAHLMASDATGRANQTSAMRANANLLGAVHVLYAGDFNMDSNQEQAWLNMVTGSGEGLAVDPLNPGNTAQTWTANSSFAAIHTQSTRVGSTPDNDGGATGGMDDRFDVQLSTQEFHDGEGLAFIAGSYRAFGNDGQHYNKAINASPTIPLGATVATALWDASDHLPVVADYQLPAKMQVNLATAAPTPVIVGATATATINVRNVAPVALAVAADELDYTITTSGPASGSFSGVVNAGTAGTGNNHAITFNTATPGSKVAVVNVTSTSQGVENGSATLSPSTTVLAHATPSFNSGTTQTSFVLDVGIWGRGESIPGIPIAVNNRPDASGFTAGLDIDSVVGLGDTAVLGYALATGGFSIAPGSARVGTASFSSANVGSFAAVYNIATSDQDLPGATNLATLQLTLLARIAIPGDATLDNSVNISDFSIVASNFNTTGQTWQTGDFTRDGSVNIADFSLLASNFNTTATALPRGAIPEPCGALTMALLLGCRRRRV